MSEQSVPLHRADGSIGGTVTLAQCDEFARAGLGYPVRSRKGQVKRFMSYPSERPYAGGWDAIAGLHNASHTTRRLPVRNDQGEAVTAPLLEHRPLPT